MVSKAIETNVTFFQIKGENLKQIRFGSGLTWTWNLHGHGNSSGKARFEYCNQPLADINLKSRVINILEGLCAFAGIAKWKNVYDRFIHHKRSIL